MIADSVGLALLVVLESLTPAERLAFVLHDMFGLPFEEIAPIIDRTPVAARKLASRARRQVHGAAPGPDPDLATQPVLVNGVAGLVSTIDGDVISIISFTIADERIVAIDILSDPARLAQLDLAGPEPS